MVNRKTSAACIAVVLGLLVAASASALNPASNHITVSGAVALPNTILPAGTYTFELVDPSNNHHVVQVLSRDRSKVLYMGITLPVERPHGMSRSTSMVTLGEAPNGAPPPITAWFPRDSFTGHQFIY
jgi:hypothetical protein